MIAHLICSHNEKYYDNASIATHVWKCVVANFMPLKNTLECANVLKTVSSES